MSHDWLRACTTTLGSRVETGRRACNTTSGGQDETHLLRTKSMVRNLLATAAHRDDIKHDRIASIGQATNTGTVIGQVTDPQGAVVPGVVITLKDAATGKTLTTSTNDQGRYAVVN